MECACVKNGTKIKKVIFVRLLSEVVGFLPSNSKMLCSGFILLTSFFFNIKQMGSE